MRIARPSWSTRAPNSARASSVWSRVRTGSIDGSHAVGKQSSEQDGGLHLRAGHRQRVLDRRETRAVNLQAARSRLRAPRSARPFASADPSRGASDAAAARRRHRWSSEIPGRREFPSSRRIVVPEFPASSARRDLRSPARPAPVMRTRVVLSVPPSRPGARGNRACCGNRPRRKNARFRSAPSASAASIA